MNKSKFKACMLVIMVGLMVMASGIFGFRTIHDRLPVNVELQAANSSNVVNFTLSETGNLNRVDEPVSVQVTDLPQGVAYHDSIRLYKNGTEVASQVWNRINHASDAFESDDPLELPDGWTAASSIEGERDVVVVPHYDGWGRVVFFYDDSYSYDNWLEKSFSNIDIGSIEILLNPRYNNWNFDISLKSGKYNNEIVYRFGENGFITRWTGSSFVNFSIPTPYSEGTWYFLKIMWNCQTDISKFYLDGQLKDESNFATNSDFINTIKFSTSDNNINKIYIAAIDFSSANGYEDGRIQYIKSCSVSFLADVSANITENYTIAWSNSTQGNPGYPVTISYSSKLGGICGDITDGNGALWKYLYNNYENRVGDFLKDPIGYELSSYWGTGRSISSTHWPICMELGPILAVMLRWNYLHTHLWTQEIYVNSYSKVTCYDQQAQSIKYDTSNTVADKGEVHYRKNGSWIKKDPLFNNPFATTTFDGMVLENHDLSTWVHAVVVNTSQPGMEYIEGKSQTAGVFGYHLGGGTSLHANTTYEYWSCVLNVSSNETEQRDAVEDLHYRMIEHPLIPTFPSSPSGSAPGGVNLFDVIIIGSIISVVVAAVGIAGYFVWKKHATPPPDSKGVFDMLDRLKSKPGPSGTEERGEDPTGPKRSDRDQGNDG